MEKIYKRSQIKLRNTPLTHKRYLYDKIKWDDRLIGITGARGTGKTTILLQRLKSEYKTKSGFALYITLDDFYFTKNRLFDFVEQFYINGGRVLFIDEVHRYRDWSGEIKNIYDIYSDLKIVFSGSSALQLHKAKGDLSRRAAMYHLHELSFREYLIFSGKKQYSPVSLTEILHNHLDIAENITSGISIIPLFKKYLETGVYPFFLDVKGQYFERLQNTIDVIIENDLPQIENISFQTAYKLRQLVALLADRVPFKVNISELSRIIGLSRDILLRLLWTLDQSDLIKGIRPKGSLSGRLTKPDKIFLNNTALLFALQSNNANVTGIARETFFMNQTVHLHDLKTISKGDFIIDGKYIFEIGGKNKDFKQIAGLKNSFIAADDIEYGFGNKIPLWLFGFLY